MHAHLLLPLLAALEAIFHENLTPGAGHEDVTLCDRSCSPLGVIPD